MYSKKVLSALVVAAALLTTGCSEYEMYDLPDNMQPGEGLVSVTLTGTVDDLGLGQTRSVFENISAEEGVLGNYTPESFIPTWMEGDSLGTFGTDDDSYGFGYKTASKAFTGEKASKVSLINAYYPYVEGATDPQAIPAILPSKQVNDGTDDFYHPYDICAGPAGLQSDESGVQVYSYTMYRPTTFMLAGIDLSDVKSLEGQYVEAIRYESATRPLSGEFTMDITGEQPVLTPTAAAKKYVELVFTEPKAVSEAVMTPVLVAPTAKKGDDITITVTLTDYVVTIQTKVLADFMPCCQHTQLSIVDYITLTREGNTSKIDINIPEDVFTLEAVDDNVTLQLSDGRNGQSFRYSIDGQPWTALTFGQPIALTKGQKLHITSTLVGGYKLTNSDIYYYNFSGTGKFKAYGKLLYMVDKRAEQKLPTNLFGTFAFMFSYSNIVDASGLILPEDTQSSLYYSTFMGCKALTAAPAIPTKTIGYSGCYSMFDGCSSLTDVPDMVATEVGNGGCEYMFYGCSSLEKAPALPATRIDYCGYYGMFAYCTSLKKAPELPATQLISGYNYGYMFYGCSNLEEGPSILPAKTLAYACYYYMFQYCNKLVKAPELPATQPAVGCYYQMFCYCSSLKKVVCGLDETNTDYCISNWLYGVADDGEFVATGAKTWTAGYDGIPLSWKVTAEPE